MRETANTSVLVIDDEEMVRDNIEEILLPRKASAESVRWTWPPAYCLIRNPILLCLLHGPAIFPTLLCIKLLTAWKALNW